VQHRGQMLSQCSYPDCMTVFEIEAIDKIKSYLINAICPKCQRLGRAKSLEIIETLKKREKQNSNVGNTAYALTEPAQFRVILEDIRSLWNVGAIFRTADAIGVSQLYLCGITGCPPRPEIAKTALGAEQTLSWQYIYHPLEIIPILKAAGVMIIGLERNAQSVPLIPSLKEKKITKPLCLVVGNENAGLSPETIANCHLICDLPMKGIKESLNVASAFAVAAYFINEFS
jgi:23S rRNA (guanosine2251-2'-O)-methyltransferase